MFTREQKKLLGKLYTCEEAWRQAKIEDALLGTAYIANNESYVFPAIVQVNAHSYKYYRSEPITFPGLINSWKRVDEESWSRVWIVEGNSVDEARAIMQRTEYYTEGYRSRYAGDAYVNPMTFRRAAPNRILVQQWGGLDV
ncbi:hypothetical protein D1872_81630 [compost metagenome]